MISCQERNLCLEYIEIFIINIDFKNPFLMSFEISMAFKIVSVNLTNYVEFLLWYQSCVLEINLLYLYQANISIRCYIQFVKVYLGVLILYFKVKVIYELCFECCFCHAWQTIVVEPHGTSVAILWVWPKYSFSSFYSFSISATLKD